MTAPGLPPRGPIRDEPQLTLSNDLPHVGGSFDDYVDCIGAQESPIVLPKNDPDGPYLRAYYGDGGCDECESARTVATRWLELLPACYRIAAGPARPNPGRAGLFN